MGRRMAPAGVCPGRTHDIATKPEPGRHVGCLRLCLCTGNHMTRGSPMTEDPVNWQGRLAWCLGASLLRLSFRVYKLLDKVGVVGNYSSRSLLPRRVRSTCDPHPPPIELASQTSDKVQADQVPSPCNTRGIATIRSAKIHGLQKAIGCSYSSDKIPPRSEGRFR